MKTKEVPSSWLRREGLRLDCGPYMSGVLDAKVALEKLGVRKDPLQEVTLGLVNAGRIKRLWVQDRKYGIPFLSSTDILHADLSNLKLIANKAVRKNPRLIIHQGWTLITRAGSIGRMAYTRPDMDGMACTEDVLRVIPDPAKTPPGYLYAYLSSKYGVPLVVSGTYGAIIQHIEPLHIANLPVPRLGNKVEDRAHKLVNEAANQLAKFQTLVTVATDRLFEETVVWNPQLREWLRDKSDLGFTISSKDLKTMRAWNHSRRAKRIRNGIRSGRWSRLGDVTVFEWLRWRKMFERREADPNHGIEVVTQKPLFNLFPVGRWISKKYLLNHSPKYIVPDETILIAKQGTLGERELYCRCEFITGVRMVARAYSDHCMRIVARKDKIHPGYLFAFLRSQAGFRLLRSLSEGAKQQDLHWRTVPEIPIPRCRVSIEDEIGEMVRRAYKLRNDAVEKLVQAVRLVEHAIEKAT